MQSDPLSLSWTQQAVVRLLTRVSSALHSSQQTQLLRLATARNLPADSHHMVDDEQLAGSSDESEKLPRNVQAALLNSLPLQSFDATCQNAALEFARYCLVAVTCSLMSNRPSGSRWLRLTER